MSNEEQFIVTCRFPMWADAITKEEHPAFGVRYLIKTPIIQPPDWEDKDIRWLTYSEEDAVVDVFKEQYQRRIGKPFSDEILFVEPCQLVCL